MRVLAVLFAVLLFCTPLLAEEQSIHVEWGYTPPSSPPVTGYQLYNEGVKSCLWPGAMTVAGDCLVTLTKDVTPFTLTAIFNDGTESQPSSVYSFDRTFTPGDNRPVLKSITIN
jgi:hypothetical protein